MKRIATIIPIVAGLAISNACADQGGISAPPGCSPYQHNTSVLNCAEPYGGADMCCETEDGYSCWSGQTQPPTPSPGCVGDPFDPNGGTGTDGGTGSDTGDWCTADCPEDMDGTCPGHAEWEKGILLWGVYKPKDSNGNIDHSANPTHANEDPVCSSAVSICFPYEHPDDIPALESNMTQDQLQACNALTSTELAALGLPLNLPQGTNGLGLVDHVCTPNSTLNTTIEGILFNRTATPTQASCLGAWDYAGFCSANDCPIEAGADSTGADSTGSDTAGAYDCAPLTSSDVSIDLTSTPRTLTVRGDAAQMFLDDAYSPFYFCSDSTMSLEGKLWDLPRGSFLEDWGLFEDDVIHSVDGVTASGDMMDALLNAINSNRVFDVEIARGTSTIEYEVEFVHP